MGNGMEEADNLVSFEDLLDEDESYKRPTRGDIRPAVVLQIAGDEIIVDMGTKRDGVVPKEDLARLPPDYIDGVAVGDEIPVYVLNPNDRDGNLLVSINLGLQGQDWVEAHKLLESGEMVEAEIIGFNRGGLLVRFGRLEGFVPASHVVDIDPGLTEPDRAQAMSDLVGQMIGLKIVEVNQGRRRLILSQREAQREWRAQQKERLLEELSVGDVTTGRVTGIRDFGVFVDLGGADGLIHVSELAWHRVPHPRDVIKVGDEVTVFVLNLDHEKQRIALSLRRVHDDPWQAVEEKYAVGQTVEGKVSNVVDFGAFVVLEDGIEGLLHVSEMADGTLTEPHSYVMRGDHVTVRVARIEADRRRIGFTQQGLDLEGPTDRPGASLAEEEEALDTDQGMADDETPAPDDEMGEEEAPGMDEDIVNEEAPAPDEDTGEEEAPGTDEEAPTPDEDTGEEEAPSTDEEAPAPDEDTGDEQPLSSAQEDTPPEPEDEDPTGAPAGEDEDA